jgi:hypothetical protein
MRLFLIPLLVMILVQTLKHRPLFLHTRLHLQIIPYTHQKVLEYYNPALPISPEGFGHFLFRFSDMTSTAVAGL